MIRAFIVIDIPKEFRRKIIKIQQKLPKFLGNKTKPWNLHLTLKFLGNVDEKKIEEARNKLNQIKFSIFETEVDEIGFFDKRKSRDYDRQVVIWLHMKSCDGLQREIDEKLFGLFEKEKRFMAHLTIARVKKVEDEKEFLPKVKKIKFDKIKFKVENFKLKSSALTKKGPAYLDLNTYHLE